MNLHGYPRFTNDIDILLALDDANLHAMAGVMHKLGYEKRLPVDIQELGDEKKVKAWIKGKRLVAYTFINAKEPQFNIDVLVGASFQFNRYKAEQMIAEVWDLRIPVVSIDDLIAMKRQTERGKDIQDVVALLELKGL